MSRHSNRLEFVKPHSTSMIVFDLREAFLEEIRLRHSLLRNISHRHQLLRNIFPSLTFS
jgi:hypothetical protein